MILCTFLEYSICSMVHLSTILRNRNALHPYSHPFLHIFLQVYVGAQAIVQLQGKIPLQNSPAMDIFKQLVASFDSEGRYHLFNAMANQLRYPNRYDYLCLYEFAATILLIRQGDLIVNMSDISEEWVFATALRLSASTHFTSQPRLLVYDISQICIQPTFLISSYPPLFLSNPSTPLAIPPPSLFPPVTRTTSRVCSSPCLERLTLRQFKNKSHECC